MKKYSKEDQKILATWALDCAEQILPLFEKAYPEDIRLKQALVVGRTWVKTGIFKMADIRSASLAAHAAAREVADNKAACFVARAVGQAVATAHVPQHAYGGSYYALKAVIAANPVNTEAKVITTYNWQKRHLNKKIRDEIMSRIIITKTNHGLSVKIQKGQDF
jgi:hypothetical protein